MNTLNKQPNGTIDNDGKHLKNDFLLRLLDEFEDYLDFKGVRIPNAERDLEESDGGANIWGEDFDYLPERIYEFNTKTSYVRTGDYYPD